MSTLRPILIVLHREQSSPGRIGRLLMQRGHALDIRRPPLGDRLPDTMAEHAGAVIFGGPMSANDSDAWIRKETDWIGVPLREEAPFLGVCLGAQMMIRHLGGQVVPNREGFFEIGYWPIQPTPAGRALCDWPERVYQWHREGFDSVAGLERLATSERFENQAVRYGRSAYGVQFHPEVSYQMMRRWSTAASHKLTLPGAQDLSTQQHEGFRHNRATAAWLSTFLDVWLASATTATTSTMHMRSSLGDVDEPPLDRLQHRLVST
ncbi:glutamine amidotransferase [Paraburkholderia flava]|uniref:glutamine amidotransferase n=1 Tax=Paraburkholderia flava TaxID=2547393 RepID=UPI00105EA4C0|nr:glutamine amidotransferase [Paraburkholderia flava]